MKTRIIVFYSAFAIFLLAASCGGESTSSSTTNNTKEKTKLVAELPPAKVCSSNVGVLQQHRDGYSKGRKTEITELKKLLESEDCEIIEISYSWVSSAYPEEMKKKLIYKKRENLLEDIYTKRWVVEKYSNVPPQGLMEFLKKGEKQLFKISEYTDSKYEFDNSQMIGEALGPKPEQDELTGEVEIVAKYILDNAKNSESISFLQWSKVTNLGKNWVVRCKYKGENSLGQTVQENKWFYIQNQKVVDSK